MIAGDLPPSLERDRRQVAPRGLRHDPPDPGRAGEHEVVERQARKALRDLALDAGDEQLGRIESRGDRLLQQRRKMRGQLARLDENAVAGGERADRGRQRELERIIPGRDDADDTERLRHQPVAGRQELQRGRDPLRRHPALQVLCRMPDLGEQQHRLGDGGLDRRTVTEIGRDCLPKTLFVVGDDAAQPRQPVEPFGKAGRWLVPRPRDHGVEGLLQRSDRGARQGFVHGVSSLRARFGP